MRYNPSETERKFDYCYYQILSQENATESTSYANITDRKDGLRIHLKVTKAKNVTVHFYGGHDRENATTWVINPNNDSLGLIKQKNIEKDATRAKSKEDEKKTSSEKKDSSEHFKIELDRKLSPDAAVEATGIAQSTPVL